MAPQSYMNEKKKKPSGIYEYNLIPFSVFHLKQTLKLFYNNSMTMCDLYCHLRFSVLIHCRRKQCVTTKCCYTSYKWQRITTQLFPGFFLFHFIRKFWRQRSLCFPCGDGLEYPHCSPASRKRRRKENPVPRGITGPPCSWGMWIWEPGPPGWGRLKWDSKVWLRVLRDSDHWVIALQTAGPSSRQRGRPTETRQQLPNSNVPTGSNIWSQVPEWARHEDILTDRQS
jgi:hypothetical protein